MASRVWTAEDLKAYGFISPEEPEIHSITNAETRRSESVDYRFKSYAFKMFLRIVCIICALFSDGWLMWLFMAAAGILPWVAVVFANSEDRARNGDFSAYLSAEHRLQLASAQQDQTSSGTEAEKAFAPFPPPHDETVDIIEGEVITDPIGHRS